MMWGVLLYSISKPPKICVRYLESAWCEGYYPIPYPNQTKDLRAISRERMMWWCEGYYTIPYPNQTKDVRAISRERVTWGVLLHIPYPNQTKDLCAISRERVMWVVLHPDMSGWFFKFYDITHSMDMCKDLLWIHNFYYSLLFDSISTLSTNPKYLRR